MQILVTGAAGMIGRKLVRALAEAGEVGGRPIAGFILADVVEPAAPEGFAGAVTRLVSDLSQPGEADKLVATRPDLVFHLAAIVSGEAEADFEKGYRINVDGARLLFEAIRRQGAQEPYCPRLVFTSSIVAFGGPFPEVIDDDFAPRPRASYGTQKVIVEHYLADYSRRGFLDGIGLRLPTICIRPGKPNKAASGFYSNILREPLIGEPAVLPVKDDLRHWFASPRAAIGFLLHAASVDTAPLGARRTLNMPGLSATVAEELDALARVAGPEAAKLVRREFDPAIAEFMSTWPQCFKAEQAEKLGFKAERSMDEIIRVHIEDELGGRIGARA